MKKSIFPFLFLAVFFVGSSFSSIEINPPTDQETITWYSWEEAIELNKKTPKKIFIDVYTDWCGWCKKMDKSTFTDPKVVAFLNENFYPVKFNAEQKNDIMFMDHKFGFVDSGRRGYHELAYTLLNGRMGYPAFVLMDEDLARIMISPGFKNVQKIMVELEFANQEKYKEMTFEQYKRTKA